MTQNDGDLLLPDNASVSLLISSSKPLTRALCSLRVASACPGTSSAEDDGKPKPSVPTPDARPENGLEDEALPLMGYKDSVGPLRLDMKKISLI
jgi:hypothetical protein